MPQVGRGFTVKVTSSVLLQTPSITVRRRVALFVTYTWVVSESGVRIKAAPDTTLQLVEVIGMIPWFASPAIVNRPTAFAEQMLWSGPAFALGPNVRLNWIGVMKSPIAALSAWESLVFTKIVLIPTLRQGSEGGASASIRAVRSMATSTNWFSPYLFVPKAP